MFYTKKNMIDSTETIKTVRPKVDEDEDPSDEDFVVKEEQVESSAEGSKLVREDIGGKSDTDSDNHERRGVKRSIDTDNYSDDLEDDESSLGSEPFKDELDDDSSEDKGWSGFAGLCKQRGSGRLSRTYGLRPRTGIRRAWVEGEAPSGRGSTRRGRGRGTPKSKYRRNTANARERDRMKEINVAFANLRGALPSFTCRRITSMTKIKTLKLAASYIRALSDLLSDSPSEESKNLALELFQDLPDQNNLVSSIKQTLSTSSITYQTPSSSQNIAMNKSDQQNIIHSTGGSVPFPVSHRSGSALEAALTNASKRPSYSGMQIRQYTQPGHHLTARPNLVPPPPLQLNSIKNISSMQSSPTQRSPSTSNLPISPLVHPSESVLNVSFDSNSSTIITANVNVISLNSDGGMNDQVYPLTPTTSPISKKSHDTIMHSPHQGLPSQSRSNSDPLDSFLSANPFLSTSRIQGTGHVSNNTITSTKTQVCLPNKSLMVSNCSQYSRVQCNFQTAHDSPSQSHLHGNTAQGATIGQQHHHSQFHLPPQYSQLYQPPHMDVQQRPRSQLHQSHQIDQQQFCAVSPNSAANFSPGLPQKSPLSPVPGSLQHNLDKVHSLQGLQSPGAAAQCPAISGGSQQLQRSASFIPRVDSSPMRSNEASTSTSRCLSGAEAADPSGVCWGGMSVELNSLLEETDRTPDDQTLNWEEFCWTLG